MDFSTFRIKGNEKDLLKIQDIIQQKRFDFVETGDFFEALNNILDGIDSQLNCMNEARAEMEAEYYSEMMSNMDFY